MVNESALTATLEFFLRRGLLCERAAEQALELVQPGDPFASALQRSESIHVHVKVSDVGDLPHDEIRSFGSEPQRQSADYVKYPFPGAVNMIFSSYPVAEDDLVGGAVQVASPFVDHLGLDLRDESASSRLAFDAVPMIAARFGWRYAHQAGPVRGCHAEVAEKHWVYPPDGPFCSRRPVEVAYGALIIHDQYLGCDLRPIDPAHPLAGAVRRLPQACASAGSGRDGTAAVGQPACSSESPGRQV